MKQYWQKISQKIDALSLRERTLMFVVISAVIITLVNIALVNPQFIQQKQLSSQTTADQNQINVLQSQIQATLVAYQVPADVAEKMRLQALKQQAVQMQFGLQDMQKGLVSPDKMAQVLEDILKRDARLRLVSLKTLPVANLMGTGADGGKPAVTSGASTKTAPSPAAAAAAVTAAGIYKHGVEISVQGSYLDMLGYVAALERMPWQLFWGKANLNVDEYPTATLTMTLFTLSLDKNWLNL